MISLCMIVRDEETFMASCLASAQPAVDEIVVVDTGSRDRTVEIARRFGARVYSLNWNDDFSYARNAALDRARGDWCLVLDADEHLDPSAPPLIREAVARGEHAGFFMPLVSLFGEGKRVECHMARLFVHRPEIRYRYLIHEQVLPDLHRYARKAGKPIGKLKATIFHEGYQPSVVHGREKAKRNRRLFLKQLDRYPDDAYSWYKFADFLHGSGGSSEELVHALERALALLRKAPDREVCTYPFAGEVAALLGLKRYHDLADPEGALALLREGADRFLPTPHLFYIKAGIERRQGRFQDAIQSYERCLNLDGDDFMVPVTQGATSFKALTGMGHCYLELGDAPQAQELFLRSIREQADQVEPYAGLSEIAYKSQDPKEALKWLMRLLEITPDHAPAWKTGAEILKNLGLEDKANHWKEKSYASSPPDKASAKSTLEMDHNPNRA